MEALGSWARDARVTVPLSHSAGTRLAVGGLTLVSFNFDAIDNFDNSKELRNKELLNQDM